MTSVPTQLRTAGIAVVALLTVVPLLSACTTSRAPLTPHSGAGTRSAAADRDVLPADRSVRRQRVFGYSVRHRPITAIEIGDPDSRRRVLVVGSIHGNEPAGIPIAHALLRSPPPEMALWVVPALNPDGVAADTRGNAHGVDLNRNFPVRWRRLGPAGSATYSGPAPRSEPETSAAMRLLRTAKPALGIWYHQPLGVVDNSQGPQRLERRYAQRTHLPLRRLTDYPGSAIGEENARFGPSAFAVELPPGALTGKQVARHRSAVLQVAHQLKD